MINYAAAYGNGGAAASYYYCSLRPVEYTDYLARDILHPA